MISDMISDMHTKVNPIAPELFNRGKKLNISLVYITKSCFAVPKDIRLHSTHYFIMKILNKREIKQIRPIIHQILTLKTS